MSIQDSDVPKGRYGSRLLHYGLVAMVTLVADQLTKWWAVANLTEAFAGAMDFAARVQRFLWNQHPAPSGNITVWDNYWNFKYVENPGAAWGFLSGWGSNLRTPFFLVLTIVAVGFIIAYFRSTKPAQRILRTALALFFGGALGNFIDRVRLGYVIDFVDWHYYAHAWPTFNVADAAITSGAILLVLDMFLGSHAEKSAARGSEVKAPDPAA